MTLEQWLHEPARPGGLPRWAAWYVQRWQRDRIVPRDWTEGEVQRARQAGKRIARDHGVTPYPKAHNRLTSDQLREAIDNQRADEPDIAEEAPELREQEDGTAILHASGTIRSLSDLLDACDFDRDKWIVRSASPLAWTQGKTQAFRVKATLWPRLDELIRPAQIEDVPPPPPARD